MESKPAEELSKPEEMELANKQQEGEFESSDRFNNEIQAMKDKLGEMGLTLTAEDIEGFRAYLATEPKWEGVYRRLANS